MKRLLEAAGGLLGLVALGVLAIALALALRGMQKDPASVSRVFESPTERTLQSPIPTPAQTPRAEPVLRVTPTPFPDRGVRAGPSTEILLSSQDVAVEQLLYGIQLEGDTLTALARTSNGRAIIEVHLQTGRVNLLVPDPEQSKLDLHSSGNYVVWTEPAPELGLDVVQIHVLDRTQMRESTIAGGHLYRLDLKDGVLVWRGIRHDAKSADGYTQGIYGYDLESGRGFATAETGSEALLLPRVCSREWIIYLRQKDLSQEAADLYAHNLQTGDSILIGQAPFPRAAEAGQQHACDGNRVAWVSQSTEQRTLEEKGKAIPYPVPVHEQHLYDLSIRTDRVLDMPIANLLNYVQFDGDVLFNGVGYDLRRDVPFDPSAGFPYEQSIGGQLLVSDERLLLLSGIPYRTDTPRRLYTAPIIRD